MTTLTTAMLVAASTVRDARRAPALDVDIARACLRASGRHGRWLLRTVDSAPGRVLLRAVERCGVPALGAHFAWRKRHIRDWTDFACGTWARQLVVLGAGFDGLAAGMVRRHPRLAAFEIDRAHGIAIKSAALSRLDAASPRHVLVAADLAHTPLPHLLAGIDTFDRALPTLFVAEGLLMYLDRAQVAGLFAGMRAACGRTPEVIATAMSCERGGPPRFVHARRWVAGWLRARGESFRWGVAPGTLARTMAACGLYVQRVADAHDARAPDPSPGEVLFRGHLSVAQPALAT